MPEKSNEKTSFHSWVQDILLLFSIFQRQHVNFNLYTSHSRALWGGDVFVGFMYKYAEISIRNDLMTWSSLSLISRVWMLRSKSTQEENRTLPNWWKRSFMAPWCDELLFLIITRSSSRPLLPSHRTSKEHAKTWHSIIISNIHSRIQKCSVLLYVTDKFYALGQNTKMRKKYAEQEILVKKNSGENACRLHTLGHRNRKKLRQVVCTADSI